MPHPELGPIALIASILTLFALPAQIRARSIPTIALVFWLFTTGFARGINAIVWENNVEIKLITWCDIVVRIQHAFATGVPGAALCIMVKLEAIASTRMAHTSVNAEKRRMYFELFMCYGLPLISTGLYYIVEGHRYDLWESFGCVPTYVGTVPTLFLVWLPPLILTCISMGFGCSVIYHFICHRRSFTQYLSTCPSSISISRYIRLMALASVEIVWELAANIYVLVYNINLGLWPYNWTAVHLDFSRIGQFPRFLVPDDIFQAFLIQWWIVPAACIAFFLFFGTGDEAMKDYRFVFNMFRKHVLRQKITESRAGFLPTHSTTSRGTVKTSTVSPYSSKGGRKPWEDISINLPDLATSPSSDDGDSMYKSAGASPITPIDKEKIAVEDSIETSRFSTVSDVGITISELQTDSRPEWPLDGSDRAASPAITPVAPAAPTSGSMTFTVTPPTSSGSEVLRFGDIKITVEKEVTQS